MFKIYGITGGAGTGKSEVMRMLRENFGGFTILMDDVARENSRKGHVSYNKIVDFFGTDILDECGELNREKLAEIVFHDKDKLEILNAATREDAFAETFRQVEKAKKSGRYKFAAVESAILTDQGEDRYFDEIWYVYTDRDIRRKRLKESRGYTDEKIDSIILNQSQESDFFKEAQFVIRNNGDLSEVYEQLKKKLNN